MTELGCIAFSFLTAFMNRVRGGYGGDFLRSLFPFSGTTFARILYSMAFAVLTGFVTHSFYAQILVQVGMHIGLLLTWKDWYDLGAVDGNKWQDLMALSVRGMWCTIPSAALLCTFSIWSSEKAILWSLVGAGMGIMYLLGKGLGKHIKVRNSFIFDEVALGELCYGFWLGAWFWWLV